MKMIILGLSPGEQLKHDVLDVLQSKCASTCTNIECFNALMNIVEKYNENTVTERRVIEQRTGDHDNEPRLASEHPGLRRTEGA